MSLRLDEFLKILPKRHLSSDQLISARYCLLSWFSLQGRKSATCAVVKWEKEALFYWMNHRQKAPGGIRVKDWCHCFTQRWHQLEVTRRRVGFSFSHVELNSSEVLSAGILDLGTGKETAVCVEQGRVAWNIPELFGHMLVSRHYASLPWVDAEQAVVRNVSHTHILDALRLYDWFRILKSLFYFVSVSLDILLILLYS